MIQPTRLIDYFFAIRIRLREDVEEQTPDVYFCYPRLPEGKENTLRNIISFCFPSSFRLPKDRPLLYHDFVLTDEKGQKRYACCFKSTKVQITGNENEPAVGELPEHYVTCFCLLSNQPRLNLLRACLNEIYLRLYSVDGQCEEFILRLIHGLIIPPSGLVSVDFALPLLRHGAQIQNLPMTQHLPVLDFSLLPIFRALSIHHVVRIFSCLLLERKILVHSQSLSLITRTCETFLAFLYPMQWEMVYVPIVPRLLRDLTQAPTPYLMGGETSWVRELDCSPIENGVPPIIVEEHAGEGQIGPGADDNSESGGFIRIDLEHDEFYDLQVQKNKLAYNLPGRDHLIQQLRQILYPGMDGIDGDFSDLTNAEKNGRLVQDKPPEQASAERALDDRIRLVFLQWFTHYFKNLDSFYRADGRFGIKKWLECFSEDERPFLSAFSRTTMFQNFIQTRGPDEEGHRRTDWFDRLVGKPEDRSPVGSGETAFKKVVIDTKPFFQSLKLKSVSSEGHFQHPVFSVAEFETLVDRQLPDQITNDFLHGLEEEIKKLELEQQAVFASDLYWMKAYCFEKMSKKMNASGVFQYKAEHVLSALSDLTQALRMKLQDYPTHPDARIIVQRIQSLVSTLPKVDIDKWISTLSGNEEKMIRKALRPAPPKPLTPHSTELELVAPKDGAVSPAPTSRSRSNSQLSHIETMDRMIMNCSTETTNHAHIDSADSMVEDEMISEHQLSAELQELTRHPVELSVRIATMILSLFKMISEPPLCVSFSGGGFVNTGRQIQMMENIGDSLTDMKAGSGKFFDFSFGFMSKSPSPLPPGRMEQKSYSERLQHVRENNFLLQSANRFKQLKGMPTFESFKHTIVALRHAKLDELSTDEDKLCFWLNVRNVLFLHVLVEFGPPSNLQHRLTFTYHKPVYNVGGHLYSLHEITHGILQTQNPLPSLYTSTLASSPVGHGIAPCDAPLIPVVDASEISRVHVMTTTSSTTSKVLSLSQSLDGSSGSKRKALTPSASLPAAGDAKIPLKFTPNDPRNGNKISQACSLICFALPDGTSYGPRFTIFKPGHLKKQLELEGTTYLNDLVSCTKIHSADVSGLSGFVGTNKKRVVSVPQYLTWHMKGLNPSIKSVEALVAHLYHLFPDTKLNKFIKEEEVLGLKKNEAEKSMAGSTLLIKVVEHEWNMEIRIPFDI